MNIFPKGESIML